MYIKQQKNWLTLPKAEDNLIKQYPDYSQVVLQLLFNRGIIAADSQSSQSSAERLRRGGEDGVKGGEADDINEFLSSDYGKYSHDPFLFARMNEAVDLIIKHIKDGNKIIIYGDYDADGVTASALLFEILTILKAKPEVYIPDRVSEGYGLNNGAIDQLIGDGAKLIITVDGGIRNKQEVDYAKSKGVDIIITDHHPALGGKEDLPDCLIINPVLKHEKYPFKYLAGVGVAFKLAKAIISKSKLNKDIKQKLEEQVLDLAAMGTVADCVRLTGENRIITKQGLESLNKTKRIGLLELIKAAQINENKKLEAWNIGFQIAPRLNAAGRMGHANTAFELLTTKNKDEAITLARRLNDRNIERQKNTEEIFNEVEKQINIKNDDKIIIGVCPLDNIEDEIWNEGIVGLVAGRICEKYYLPALVITKTKDGYKGSGRSIDELDLIEAVKDCEEFLDKYGGHPAACGFSLAEKNMNGFAKKIKQIAAEKLASIDLMPKIKIEMEIDLDEIDEKIIKDVELFAPFGQRNEKPKFMSGGVLIVDIATMGIGGKHIKFKVKNEKSGIISAIGFSQAEQWQDLRIGDKIDIVYYIELNEFNGRVDVQLKIIDIKLHNK
ncbi:single-stranded-DNA-specific exonuclease RecJ [Patescibacteria group bacterium]|nr:single-stranded-DNA-specific exonuclease RecJ [Candidatus Falkowbacteria bacterium]MBU3905791.1 single-stranded-DNA-specific exonuclease RecJ [Patescibacteria group bacterium]MBU4025986.1 single-stranded-DNA-specific exonuclease RecJ [Patescibacteria group bacterium]MBU4072888.1 single-stranded-DNA-specific exonuclease RecJ [Patescibacteria group bacterium]MBU4102558.1 single-stranded-DNA-specific exonuclease RecJ [Patescibacteria group bacterium]